jgi:hypothetical protein
MTLLERHFDRTAAEADQTIARGCEGVNVTIRGCAFMAAVLTHKQIEISVEILHHLQQWLGWRAIADKSHIKVYFRHHL